MVRAGNKRRLVIKYRMLYLFVAPGVIGLLLFSYAPMFGLAMVFQDYNPISGFLGSPWSGFDNFQTLFNSPVFLRALRNTLIISTMKLVIVFPLPILFALLLNELRVMKFKRSVQTITYLPNFVSWVIVSGIFYKMLSPEDGIINHILVGTNMVDEPIRFMQSYSWFYTVIIMSDIWKSLGYLSIFYLASIASIEPELYEAAEVDGAGRFKQALYITLPGISTMIALQLLLAVSGLMSAGFDQLWTMGNLSVIEIGDILDTAVLRYLTTGNISDLSVGAAMGLFQSVVGLILLLVANWLAGRANPDYKIV